MTADQARTRQDGDSGDGIRFGFRRRCGWCAVQLRGWQLNLCRLCRPRATGSAGIYQSAGGPPCSPGARYNASADPWRSR